MKFLQSRKFLIINYFLLMVKLFNGDLKNIYYSSIEIALQMMRDCIEILYKYFRYLYIIDIFTKSLDQVIHIMIIDFEK